MLKDVKMNDHTRYVPIIAYRADIALKVQHAKINSKNK